MSIISLLQENAPFFLFITFFLGLSVGSFLNVVIYRLPKMLFQGWRSECRELLEITAEANEDTITLSKPASTCPACGHKIRAWENIPVLSYLVLRGKCASCGSRISIRYPLIELSTGLLSILTVSVLGFTAEGIFALLLLYVLIAASMIDIDHQILPDQMTLPMVWAGILFNLFAVYTNLASSVVGAMAGYLSLWSVYWAFKLLTGKEGMGYGDFKLLAVFGAWLGWQYIPQIILISAIVGAIIGISMILIQGRDKSIPIPFGPYLAIAGFIALLYGEQINRTYLQIAGIG